MASLKIDESVFDRLAEILKKHGLSEIEYKYGEIYIKMSMNSSSVAVVTPSPVVVQESSVSPPAVTTTEAPVVNNDTPVKSPMVGVCYLAPDPESPNFVKVGDSVKEGQPLFIIESMKVMNLIKATQAGTITRIEMASGDPVEYGQIVMAIAA